MRPYLEQGRTLHADGTVGRTVRAVLPVEAGGHRGRLLFSRAREGAAWVQDGARVDCEGHECRWSPELECFRLADAGVLELVRPGYGIRYVLAVEPLAGE